jgi:SAM-dependent methyltransferase
MKTRHEPAKIRAAIKEKYALISASASGRFTYPTGLEGAQLLGYDPGVLSAIPAEMMASFCGVGNPFRAGVVHAGEVLLDIGCGAGLDLIVAGRYLGPTGRSCGIDLTSEMASLATRNAAAVGLAKVEVQEGSVESIPYEAETFDAVISNGVLNLSPEKELAFAEIARVLAPGGRLQFADIILEGDQARESPWSLEAWSD